MTSKPLSDMEFFIVWDCVLSVSQTRYPGFIPQVMNVATKLHEEFVDRNLADRSTGELTPKGKAILAILHGPTIETKEG